jgi:hypothetical protein
MQTYTGFEAWLKWNDKSATLSRYVRMHPSVKQQEVSAPSAPTCIVLTYITLTMDPYLAFHGIAWYYPLSTLLQMGNYTNAEVA